MAASYEVRGLPQNLTSYDNAAPNSGNIVNDVQFVYNDFAELIADYQSHSGPVDMASTASVGYTYEDGSSGTIRRTGVVYPDGRADRPPIRRGQGRRVQSRHGHRRRPQRHAAAGAICPAGPRPLRSGRLPAARVPATWPSARAPTRTPASTSSAASSTSDGGIRPAATDVDRIQHGYDLLGNRLWRQNPVAASLGVKPRRALQLRRGESARHVRPRAVGFRPNRAGVRHGDVCPGLVLGPHRQLVGVPAGLDRLGHVGTSISPALTTR